jgi:hypothetical protein
MSIHKLWAIKRGVPHGQEEPNKLHDHRPPTLALRTVLQHPASEKPIASPELLTVEGSRLTSGCWIWWSDFA